MGIKDYKISDQAREENQVKSAPDVLAETENMTRRDVKHFFDRYPDLIAEAHNGMADYIGDNYRTAVEENAVHEMLKLEAGAADMTKAKYDKNNNEIVDDSERLGGQLPEYYARKTDGVLEYTHLAEDDVHTLTGTGSNGKFKATSSGEVSAFTVGEEAYTVKCGEETAVELTEGNWYSFILDDGAKTVNFKSGGGAQLNFKVVGGTAQPENPKENTIWVNTDVEITGYTISISEPSNAEEGWIWLRNDGNGTVSINLIKKQNVELSLLQCWQYVEGVWVEKEGKVYQNGSWNSVVDYILKNGIYSDLIAGDITTVTNTTSGGYKTGSAAMSGNYLRIKTVTKSDSGASNGDHCPIGFPKAIDVTNIESINLHFASASFTATNALTISVGLSTVSNKNSPNTAKVSLPIATSGYPKTATINTSSLNGEYWLVFDIHQGYKGNTNYINCASITFNYK